jgi:hypothetical protein
MLNGARCVTKPDETVLDWTITDVDGKSETVILTNDTWFKTCLVLYFGEGHVVY